MVSAAGAPHLTSHHRNTMRKLFQRPAGHNIEWPDVVSMLEAVGSVQPRRDGKAKVTVGSETKVIDEPADKDIDTETVVMLRHMLTAAGYGPESYDDRKD
jgi:hypothetical protein